MFVDIPGFTKLTETLMKHKKNGAEILTEVMNHVFHPIVKTVYQNGGIISTYAGDAFTAIFRIDPVFGNAKVDHGILNSAVNVRKYFKENETLKTPYGNFKMGVKAGLSYGEINWGIIGKGGKYTYYFKGEAIDGCTKSEQIAKKNEIVLDDRIVRQLEMDRNQLTAVEDGYFKFLPGTAKPESGVIESAIPEYTNEDLQPFIFDSVINFKGKAEFRKVVSVFISFDESENEPVLNEFVGKLIEESYNRGGYFNKIDFGDKGGVALVLFGAPVSYENNIERALNFILHLRSNITDMKFRAGITYGTVYAGIMGGNERSEYTAIGDTVNLSARYMMRAGWNEFWISEDLVNAGKKNYSFKKVGDLEFKGKTGVLPVYELINRKEGIEASFFNTEIVGRDEELRQLEDFLNPLSNDNFSGVVYVYGEAGIGKSRLVYELKKQVIDDVNWFCFPCEEILRKSFNPIIYFLKNYFNISYENSAEENKQNYETRYAELLSCLELEKPEGELREIILELDRTKTIIGGYLEITWEDSLFSQLDPRGKYNNFIYAVKNLIKAASSVKPVIIELEDTHWIDTDTEEFCKVLARNIDNYPIAIICSLRYNDDGSEFKLNLDKKVTVNRILLDCLRKSDVSGYAGLVLNTDKELSEELLDLVYEKTNGNPFFAEQLLLDLQERNLIKTDNQKRLYSDNRDPGNIPINIQTVVISRLDRLSDEIKSVIQTASVLGREFLITILTHVLLNENELDKKLYLIEKERIWLALSEFKYIFRHALLRDAAYDMQLHSRLKELHKFAAESYEEVFRDNAGMYYGDIAYHYEKAEIENRAIEYLDKAGDYAAENYHNEEAIEYFRTLINEYQLTAKRSIDVKLKHGKALELSGRWNEAETVYRECLSEVEGPGNKQYIAECTRYLGEILYSKGIYKEAMQLLRKSLDLAEELGDKEGMNRATGSIGMIHYNQGNYKESLECYNRSLSICEEISDRIGISKLVRNIGIVYWRQANRTKAFAFFEKSLSISQELGNTRGISAATGNLGLVYADEGDSIKAMDCFEKQLIISQKIGDKEGITRATGNMGAIYYDLGDFTSAMDCFEKQLAICEELGEKIVISHALGNIGIVFEEQGNYEKAMEYYQKQSAICEELGDKEGINRAIGSIAVLCKDMGYYAKALEYYEKALKIDYELNLKPYLPYHLLGKTICLYKMNKYKEAEKYNEMLYDAAREIDNKEQCFKHHVLTEKINFERSGSTQNRMDSIGNLKAMLKVETEEVNIAALNYEISFMLRELNEDSSEFAGRAIEIYRNLYKNTPRIEYKNRYEELENTTS